MLHPLQVCKDVAQPPRLVPRGGVKQTACVNLLGAACGLWHAARRTVGLFSIMDLAISTNRNKLRADHFKHLHLV